MAEDEKKVYRLTSNIIRKRSIFGKIPIRNLVEGILTSGIVLLIINSLSFVPKFKLIASLLYAGVIIVFNCRGIYNRSISETIIDYAKFLYRRRILHLGSIANERKQEKYINLKFEGQSYAEKFISAIKHKYAKIREDALNDNDSAEK